MRIVWTEPAATALENIQDHIARDNPRAAFEVAQRIWLAVSQLREHPEIGRIGRIRNTYKLVLPNIPHIFPYRIKNKEVQILTVYHTSRKWPVAFD